MEKERGKERGETEEGRDAWVGADDLCTHMVINGPERGEEAEVLADKGEAEEEGMSGSQS